MGHFLNVVPGPFSSVSYTQDLKQNLTIVSDAANFAGNMPTTALIGRRLLILAARGMMCYI